MRKDARNVLLVVDGVLLLIMSVLVLVHSMNDKHERETLNSNTPTATESVSAPADATATPIPQPDPVKYESEELSQYSISDLVKYLDSYENDSLYVSTDTRVCTEEEVNMLESVVPKEINPITFATFERTNRCYYVTSDTGNCYVYVDERYVDYTLK